MLCLLICLDTPHLAVLFSACHIQGWTVLLLWLSTFHAKNSTSSLLKFMFLSSPKCPSKREVLRQSLLITVAILFNTGKFQICNPCEKWGDRRAGGASSKSVQAERKMRVDSKARKNLEPSRVGRSSLNLRLEFKGRNWKRRRRQMVEDLYAKLSIITRTLESQGIK